jgi:membrane protease YdiL (CAAX protease family)
MTLNAVDHLIVAILVLVVPCVVVLDYRKLIRALQAGDHDARLRAYRQSIGVQWGFTALLVGFWLWTGRTLPALGLGLVATPGLWVGLALTLAACAFLIYQVALVRRHPEAREAVRAQIGSLRPLLPHTRREERGFTALSVTAGVCEEVVYRGFLMAYFDGFGVVSAILLSTLAFGLAHAYMGKVAAIRAGFIGLVVAGLYWLTGSLWASMLLHVTADTTSGIMARVSYRGEPNGAYRRAHGDGKGLSDEWDGWENEGSRPEE